MAPVQEERRRNVEGDVRHADAKVAPSMRVARADAREKDVCVGNRAVAAVGCGVAVPEIASGGRDEVVEELAACLAAGRIEMDELVGGTGDVRVGQARRQDGRDPVGEGREAVHEDPEAGHAVGAGQDAAEDEAHHEEDVGQVAARLGGVGDGDAGVGKGAREDEELPEQQPHEAASLGDLACRGGVLVEADGVVDADEHDDGHERVPRDLGDDLGQHEDLPAVRLGRPLADLVERALDHKVRHLLLHQLPEDGEDVEDGEHLVLQALDAERGVEEDEADEERDEEAEEELGVDVRRRAPDLLEDALRDDEELGPEGRGELGVRGLVVGIIGVAVGVAVALVLEALKLGLDVLIFLALEPGPVPIHLRRGSRGSTDGLQHPFGRILVRGALGGAVSLEIRRHDGRVVANVTEIDGPPALCEEQEPVEALEQHRGRLVDGAQDRLACLGELFQQVEDGPGRLRVEARGRLVDEQQQWWLCSEFDAYRQPLPLFDIQPLAQHADDGVRILLHVQQLDDLVDIRQLLGPRRARGLAQQSAELERLADRRRLEMEVLLLHVSRLALERVVPDLAVHQHLARDDAHGDAVGQAVEQRRFTGARHAHEGGEGAWLDPAVDVVEDATRFALDLDVVADVAPVEDAGRGLDHGVAVLRGFGVALLGRRRGGQELGAAEDEDLALGLFRLDEVCGDKVDEVVEQHKGNQNADVAPLVRVEIPVLRVDVGIAAHKVLARDGPDGGAGAVRGRDVLVARDRGAGDEGVALEAAAAELVDHEGLEAVGHGVEVVDPAAPAKHVVDGDDEAGEDDHGEDEQRGGDHGLREGPREGGSAWA
ncbi:hypothetical protein CCMA1212_010383 [Trichoderma ghanense]|uniref:Uncharacterized protein n=1 Tax=Trichoderma ghanense TaxID=65468 RepID=A0ABY2GQ66_9HYPO